MNVGMNIVLLTISQCVSLRSIASSAIFLHQCYIRNATLSSDTHAKHKLGIEYAVFKSSRTTAEGLQGPHVSSSWSSLG